MAFQRLKIRAVIFDVYATLLQVGPPPADAGERWQALFRETFDAAPPMGLLDFSIACHRAIQARHEAARAGGIPYPEILWPAIVAEVLPTFTRLAGPVQTEFVYHQMQLGRTVSLMADAGPVLRRLRVENRRLGIASNAQAYTLRELELSLAGA